MSAKIEMGNIAKSPANKRPANLQANTRKNRPANRRNNRPAVPQANQPANPQANPAANQPENLPANATSEPLRNIFKSFDAGEEIQFDDFKRFVDQVLQRARGLIEQNKAATNQQKRDLEVFEKNAAVVQALLTMFNDTYKELKSYGKDADGKFSTLKLFVALAKDINILTNEFARLRGKMASLVSTNYKLIATNKRVMDAVDRGETKQNEMYILGKIMTAIFAIAYKVICTEGLSDEIIGKYVSAYLERNGMGVVSVVENSV